MLKEEVDTFQHPCIQTCLTIWAIPARFPELVAKLSNRRDIGHCQHEEQTVWLHPRHSSKVRTWKSRVLLVQRRLSQDSDPQIHGQKLECQARQLHLYQLVEPERFYVFWNGSDHCEVSWLVFPNFLLLHLHDMTWHVHQILRDCDGSCKGFWPSCRQNHGGK